MWREFLWAWDTDEKKNLSLVAWDKLCQAKKYGGLNCRLWNMAAVGELVWMVMDKRIYYG